MEALPRISLVTPSFMQAAFLDGCLTSVREQAYPSLEHIVVDGGSTDGSVQLIEQASSTLAWWCAEKDQGQSHAINKGLSHATGDVFGWLNSDDLLLPGSLAQVGAAFAADPDLVVYGGRRILRSMTDVDTPSGLDDASRPDALFTDPKVNQQSTFYRLGVVKAIGGVETALHYAMDLELWWQVLFAQGTDHLRFDALDLAVFRYHPDSKTVRDQAAFRSETAAILRQLAVQVDQHDLVAVLDQGYPDRIALRPMSVDGSKAPIIRRMIVRFLLKWNHMVHERSQFEMMRLFRRTVDLRTIPLDEVDTERLTLLDGQLRVPGWLAFRLKRKFDHLVR
ncbi:MAG TPA: glycosyltransferase family 2 protein [Flavobacteriales bacterium]|nr:glycosyltransferase family 2 protein [Flavobacteriales bacterium]